MSFSNPEPEQIRALLKRVRHIALVGYSPNPGRPSHNIGRMMQRYGFRITPVRPGIAEGLGEKAYPDLAAIPDPAGIDLVDVFRAPAHVAGIIDDCLRLGYKAIWLQDGVIDEAAAERAVAGGMTVIMDRCILRDYTRLVAAA
ncbi:MAG: CoA-binding protein [Betaproteobacteria bacterium]|nr:CoA-binding protein [Betaproteobacteria bacterium]